MKINFHLIAVLAVLITLVMVNWQYGNETFVFFGFAENKEMEIRVDHPCTVQNIYITPGNKVKKGDILMEVTRSDLGLTQSDLNHDIAQLESELSTWKMNVRSSISQLEAEKVVKQSAIQAQIERIESEIAINQSLIKDLESIKPAKNETGRSTNEVKIDGLKARLALVVEPINAEIQKFRNQLSTAENPTRIEINRLKKEQTYVHQEEEKLTIFAPNNGIVGSIYCKVGEQFPSFKTLITFYEETPSQVKAYVLESLILNVNMGDEVIVSSSVQSGNSCMGEVVGMGSRIVEIPERLRRNPAYKTYGREILIGIPTGNSFLQKEKVILKLPLDDENGEGKVVKVLTPPKTSSTNQTTTKPES